MAKRLNIVEWPAAVLATKSAEVTVFDAALKEFVADMHDTMDGARGVGLAANQVGVAKRILTIHVSYSQADADENEPQQWWHNQRFVFINPVIERKEGKIRWQEGCLSFPDIYEYLNRASEVWVSAVDADGKPFSVHATGLLAVCLQHEIDHIDGIVFVDHMTRLKASMIKKKLMRRGRLWAEENEGARGGRL